MYFFFFFRVLFEFEEGSQQGLNRTAEPTLDITCATFQVILDFIYTGKVVIDNDNIEEILKASDLLLMTDLKVRLKSYSKYNFQDFSTNFLNSSNKEYSPMTFEQFRNFLLNTIGDSIYGVLYKD